MKTKILPYQGIQLDFFPGDITTTLAGTAIVTRTELAGRETIIWADYGSGIEQPHVTEFLIAPPKPETMRQSLD